MQQQLVSLALVGVALSAGCGQNDGPGKLHPVSGKVTLAGQPLRTGSVSFRPDPSRGNDSQHIPSGQIDADGRYPLTTADRAGAPPGWYKVVVIAQDLGAGAGNKGGTPARVKSLVPPRYLDVQNTPLRLQVVEAPAPGAYDLTLGQ